MSNKTYFLVGDLHGNHPKNLMIELIDSGFINHNKSHIVCVAGDITDGLGFDSLLINYLMILEKQEQLIAVKGNHDEWTYKYNRVKCKMKEKDWLRKLPYQIETEHFYLAHGIWLDKKKINISDIGFCSSWGSPCLIGSIREEWRNIENEVILKINTQWKDIEDYEKELDKPLFIGHFHNPTQIYKYIVGSMESYRDKKVWTNKVSFDEEGQISYGKIHFIGSDFCGSRVKDKSNTEEFIKSRKIKIKKIKF